MDVPHSRAAAVATDRILLFMLRSPVGVAPCRMLSARSCLGQPICHDPVSRLLHRRKSTVPPSAKRRFLHQPKEEGARVGHPGSSDGLAVPADAPDNLEVEGRLSLPTTSR